MECDEKVDVTERDKESKERKMKDKNSEKQIPDKDLDDLLDSALKDFDKKPETVQDGSKQTGQASIDQKVEFDNKDEMSEEQEALFNELFSAAGNEDQGSFEEMMKKLLSGQPEVLQQLENMAESFDTIGPPDGSSSDIDETLQQTLNNLAQNAQGLQDNPPDEEIIRMLSGVGLGEDGASGNTPDLDFLPMMQTMMKSLMSKEVLYPSLKDISDKFPKWLEENESKLSEKQVETYRKQNELMKIIVKEYESETTEDSEDVKKTRFERIMDIMQKMQELGQPPKDLVGEMPPGFEVDENGLPKIPGSPDQCSIM